MKTAVDRLSRRHPSAPPISRIREIDRGSERATREPSSDARTVEGMRTANAYTCRCAFDDRRSRSCGKEMVSDLYFREHRARWKIYGRFRRKGCSLVFALGKISDRVLVRDEVYPRARAVFARPDIGRRARPRGKKCNARDFLH